MYMTMQPANDRGPSGYAARRKSPVGIGGAIAVHAVVVGAFLLMPKEIITEFIDPPLTTTNIPLAPPPPENKPQEQAKTPVQPNPLPEPTAIKPEVTVPIRPTMTGQSEPGIDMGTGHDPVIAPPPPLPRTPEPIFVDATIAPNALGYFQPDYPGAMIRQGQDGSVTVRVTISPEGRVTDIVKLSATDDAFWLATQRHALRKWRFRPATRDGMAVSSSKTLTVRFTLTDR